MKYQFDSIQILQLEITTNCNASCPQCPRNNYGGRTISELPLITWSMQDMQTVLSVQFVKQLKFVYFCGTYGDPMFNKSIADMCRWLNNCNPEISIGIHTNGSLGNPQTYKKLASLVDFISFGIDGLEDTNSVYRRNTNWSTIIKNAKNFISYGGIAHWDYIVFNHNQHQVEKAKLLSKQLGFSTFNIKKTYRFFNKTHELVPSLDVLDDDGTKCYELRPPALSKYLNKNMQIINFVDKKNYASTTQISCAHLEKNEIYIGADGFVFPCGWLHDRLYGVESQKTSDRKKLYQMMDDIGGKNLANCFKTPISQIVDGPWFDAIQQSWTSESDRIERCGWLCGNNSDFIKEQNEFLQYNI